MFPQMLQAYICDENKLIFTSYLIMLQEAENGYDSGMSPSSSISRISNSKENTVNRDITGVIYLCYNAKHSLLLFFLMLEFYCMYEF